MISDRGSSGLTHPRTPPPLTIEGGDEREEKRESKHPTVARTKAIDRGESKGWQCHSEECLLSKYGACTEAFHAPVPTHLWHVRRRADGEVDEAGERDRAERLIARLPCRHVGEGKEWRALDCRFSWEGLHPSAPPSAGAMPASVLRHDAFERALAGHPDRLKVALLLDTIRNGANVGFDGPRPGTGPQRNHTVDEEHIAFLRDETDGDIRKERTRGWFRGVPPLPAMYFSPLHVVPKKRAGEAVGLRKILDASAPKGASVNDGMRKILTRCETWDQVLSALKRCGRHAWLVKRDLKAAFRHVRIRACDHHLHGITVRGEMAYEVTLAFGVRTSPAIWDRVASALTWILKQRGAHFEIAYYVDDFLLIVPRGQDPHAAAALFDATCAELGLTVAHEKNEGPTTHLVYTGTGIDTESMTVYLPPDRKAELLRLVRAAMATHGTKAGMRLKACASLIGKMIFACRAMPAAKPFTWQLSQLHANATKKVFLTDEAMRDLRWWEARLPAWDGSSMLSLAEWSRSADISLETDACRSGWGAVWGARWAHDTWSREERQCATGKKTVSMPWMELYAIVAAAKLWGHEWRGMKIAFVGDCLGLVKALNRNYLRRPKMAALLRVLANHAVECGFEWRCEWIAGKTNTRADALSRLQIAKFRKDNPTTNENAESLIPLGRPTTDAYW